MATKSCTNIGILCVSITFLFIGTAVFPPQADAVTMDEAVELFRAARDGDDTAITPCIEAFEMLNAEDPNNGTYLAHLGLCYGFSARSTWNPIKKSEIAGIGLDFLDMAVENAPEDTEVRLFRAHYQLNLPFFFGRGDDAIEDMIVLDELFRKNPSPGIATWILPLYEVLIEEAPDRGDWSVGIALAEEWTHK